MKSMKNIISLIFTFLFLVNFSQAFSQVSSGLELIIHHNSPFLVKDLPVEEKNNIIIPSDPKGILTFSINFYQSYISTQDMPSCVFIPSCSHFAEQSIHHFGLIKGIILTSDRLQRCNNFSDKSHWYQFDLEVERFCDPIKSYGDRK